MFVSRCWSVIHQGKAAMAGRTSRNTRSHDMTSINHRFLSISIYKVNLYDVRTPAMKIWTHIYRHLCLINNQETHQTNPMAPWDPLDVSLNPLGTPASPNRPPGTPKQVSWPHCNIKITSTALQIIRGPIKFPC